MLKTIAQLNAWAEEYNITEVKKKKKKKKK
jgi:hypothetical protein